MFTTHADKEMNHGSSSDGPGRQGRRGREGKYLTFALAGEEYGIGILKVKEIIGLMPITTVPQTRVTSRASSTSGGRSSP